MRIHSPMASVRGVALGALALALSSPAAAAAGASHPVPTLPFMPVETGVLGAVKALDRRQQAGCIANTYSCAGMGAQFANICCPNSQLCRLDDNNQPACCPANAVCTGTAPATFRPPTTTAPVSFVPNQFFPFAYITTSFPNQGACSAAISQCSRNYDTCTSQLQGQGGGAGNGVTIVVPGGNGAGTTIAAGTHQNLGPQSATSICGALSSTACFNIQPTVCTSQGNVGVFFVGSENAAARARPTPPPGLPLAHLVVGVGLGVMGAL
ncbi:hypothetical protein RB597_004443 [Gaeumannomyces tritici]